MKIGAVLVGAMFVFFGSSAFAQIDIMELADEHQVVKKEFTVQYP